MNDEQKTQATNGGGYPTLAERLAVAHAGGRNGVTPGFPPPDEPRAITAALQAIYEAARGNANGARLWAREAARLWAASQHAARS